MQVILSGKKNGNCYKVMKNRTDHGLSHLSHYGGGQQILGLVTGKLIRLENTGESEINSSH